MAAYKDIPAGTVYGRLTVLGPSDRGQYGQRFFRCLCACGVEAHVHGNRMRTGRTKSCGCMARDPVVRKSLTHGQCYSRTYNSYQTMKARCTNPRNPNYPKYGGAGVSICSRWLASYENFLADMGERPGGTTIDRIDNNGNYEPGNCRWATKREQQNNRDACHFIEVGGERLTLSDAARKIGMDPSVLKCRIWLGWTTERAITQPVKHRRRTSPAVETP